MSGTPSLNRKKRRRSILAPMQLIETRHAKDRRRTFAGALDEKENALPLGLPNKPPISETSRTSHGPSPDTPSRTPSKSHRRRTHLPESTSKFYFKGIQKAQFATKPTDASFDILSAYDGSVHAAETSFISKASNDSSSGSEGDILNQSVLSDTTELTAANFVLATSSKQLWNGKPKSFLSQPPGRQAEAQNKAEPAESSGQHESTLSSNPTAAKPPRDPDRRHTVGLSSALTQQTLNRSTQKEQEPRRESWHGPSPQGTSSPSRIQEKTKRLISSLRSRQEERAKLYSRLSSASSNASIRQESPLRFSAMHAAIRGHSSPALMENNRVVKRGTTPSLTSKEKRPHPDTLDADSSTLFDGLQEKETKEGTDSQSRRDTASSDDLRLLSFDERAETEVCGSVYSKDPYQKPETDKFILKSPNSTESTGDQRAEGSERSPVDKGLDSSALEQPRLEDPVCQHAMAEEEGSGEPGKPGLGLGESADTSSFDLRSPESAFRKEQGGETFGQDSSNGSFNEEAQKGDPSIAGESTTSDRLSVEGACKDDLDNVGETGIGTLLLDSQSDNGNEKTDPHVKDSMTEGNVAENIRKAEHSLGESTDMSDFDLRSPESVLESRYKPQSGSRKESNNTSVGEHTDDATDLTPNGVKKTSASDLHDLQGACRKDSASVESKKVVTTNLETDEEEGQNGMVGSRDSDGMAFPSTREQIKNFNPDETADDSDFDIWGESPSRRLTESLKVPEAPRMDNTTCSPAGPTASSAADTMLAQLGTPTGEGASPGSPRAAPDADDSRDSNISLLAESSGLRVTPNGHEKLTPTKLNRPPRKIVNPKSVDSPARNTRSKTSSCEVPEDGETQENDTKKTSFAVSDLRISKDTNQSVSNSPPENQSGTPHSTPVQEDDSTRRGEDSMADDSSAERSSNESTAENWQVENGNAMKQSSSILLSSSLRKQGSVRREGSFRKSVAFGSPKILEYNVASPPMSATPMPSRKPRRQTLMAEDTIEIEQDMKFLLRSVDDPSLAHNDVGGIHGVGGTPFALGQKRASSSGENEHTLDLEDNLQAVLDGTQSENGESDMDMTAESHTGVNRKAEDQTVGLEDNMAILLARTQSPTEPVTNGNLASKIKCESAQKGKENDNHASKRKWESAQDGEEDGTVELECDMMQLLDAVDTGDFSSSEKRRKSLVLSRRFSLRPQMSPPRESVDESPKPSDSKSVQDGEARPSETDQVLSLKPEDILRLFALDTTDNLREDMIFTINDCFGNSESTRSIDGLAVFLEEVCGHMEKESMPAVTDEFFSSATGESRGTLLRLQRFVRSGDSKALEKKIGRIASAIGKSERIGWVSWLAQGSEQLLQHANTVVESVLQEGQKVKRNMVLIERSERILYDCERKSVGRARRKSLERRKVSLAAEVLKTRILPLLNMSSIFS